ncbi:MULTISPECIES: hypothetical protein [unclassified Cupriavidus]|uniref:hypothetical protein n=1 Tax=unclassified Cupriavidus TaxID=2640874 RepID=UPI001AE38733|nr:MULTISPECIES: hypothetical protein [unclassified Cupriavidus]MBP0633142.1 hypothetical protein [Cupriavidus sp. AcVe19-1a]MBP0639782.1 hypothetical protein [Cupriavidus sp. AcVe19-6a]
MGYLILPIATVLFCLGIVAQSRQLSEAAPGAGVAGRMESIAMVTAQQAQAYGSACVSTAGATPGLIGASVIPVLPSGMVAPAGAGCMAVANPGGGRDIYGYVRVSSGASGALLNSTDGSLAWFRVRSQGTAVNLATGIAYSVPATIPVGALVHWVQLNT